MNIIGRGLTIKVEWASLFGIKQRKQRAAIEKFIDAVKGYSPSLIIGYDYDAEADFYDIWHNSFRLQYNDVAFARFIGGKIQEFLYSRGYYNFSFGYDYNRFRDTPGE